MTSQTLRFPGFPPIEGVGPVVTEIPAAPRIGVLNAHMFGTPAEIGEHVNWSTPDVFTLDEFVDLLGDPAAYAEASPHMILFEIR